MKKSPLFSYSLILIFLLFNTLVSLAQEETPSVQIAKLDSTFNQKLRQKNDTIVQLSQTIKLLEQRLDKQEEIWKESLSIWSHTAKGVAVNLSAFQILLVVFSLLSGIAGFSLFTSYKEFKQAKQELEKDYKQFQAFREQVEKDSKNIRTYKKGIKATLKEVKGEEDKAYQYNKDLKENIFKMQEAKEAAEASRREFDRLDNKVQVALYKAIYPYECQTTQQAIDKIEEHGNKGGTSLKDIVIDAFNQVKNGFVDKKTGEVKVKTTKRKVNSLSSISVFTEEKANYHIMIDYANNPITYTNRNGQLTELKFEDLVYENHKIEYKEKKQLNQKITKLNVEITKLNVEITKLDKEILSEQDANRKKALEKAKPEKEKKLKEKRGEKNNISTTVESIAPAIKKIVQVERYENYAFRNIVEKPKFTQNIVDEVGKNLKDLIFEKKYKKDFQEITLGTKLEEHTESILKYILAKINDESKLQDTNEDIIKKCLDNKIQEFLTCGKSNKKNTTSKDDNNEEPDTKVDAKTEK